MKRVAMLVVMAAGCGSGLESLGEVQSAGLRECPPSGPCPTNSPVIDTYRFHDLNRLGVPNAQGLSVKGFEVDGKELGLEVENGYLLGRIDPSTVRAGAELAGGVIRIGDELGHEYLIKIDEVGTGAYWARLGGTNPPLELYRLSWASAPPDGSIPSDNDFSHVCPEPADENDALGMPGFTATLYEGDRIDADTVTVSPKIDTDWFNLGCVGHAVAKLALTGHTEAAKSVGFDTTTAERQAVLKMFAADYCGIGVPFTVAGQPLAFADEYGRMEIGSLVEFEARWTEHGAACLDVPRVDARPTALSIETFGKSVEDEIKATCSRPPPCGTPDFDGAHMITGTP